MKLFCAALTAAPVTGDNSIVPIAIIAMAVVVVIAAVLLLTSRKNKCRLPTACHVQAVFFISGRPISFLNLYNDFRPGNATPPGKILRQGQKIRAIWHI